MLGKNLFFRVLCVFCVIRDSDSYFVRIADYTEYAEDAEASLVHFRVPFTKCGGVSKHLFFRVLCVFRVIRDSDKPRDSDKLRVQDISFLFLKRGSNPWNTFLTSKPFNTGCTYKANGISMLIDIRSIGCLCDWTTV